jgi:hypothetical protein
MRPVVAAPCFAELGIERARVASPEPTRKESRGRSHRDDRQDGRGLSGEWSLEGGRHAVNDGTDRKGNRMPPYDGKAVTWQLTQYA